MVTPFAVVVLDLILGDSQGYGIYAGINPDKLSHVD